jgi:hypothetical protein
MGLGRVGIVFRSDCVMRREDILRGGNVWGIWRRGCVRCLGREVVRLGWLKTGWVLMRLGRSKYCERFVACE